MPGFLHRPLQAWAAVVHSMAHACACSLSWHGICMQLRAASICQFASFTACTVHINAYKSQHIQCRTYRCRACLTCKAQAMPTQVLRPPIIIRQGQHYLPSRSISLLWAASKSDSPSGTLTVLVEPSFWSWKVTEMLHVW